MLVVERLREIDRLLRNLSRAVEVVALEARVGEPDEKPAAAGVIGVEQLGRPREQARRGVRIVPCQCRPSGGGEPLARTARQLARTLPSTPSSSR